MITRAFRSMVGTPGCTALGGACQINPATGNLTLQAGPPASDGLSPNPVQSYNNLATGSTELGAGWSDTYRRSFTVGGSFQVNITTGDGTIYRNRSVSCLASSLLKRPEISFYR